MPTTTTQLFAERNQEILIFLIFAEKRSVFALLLSPIYIWSML